jgi:hypothetical protein
MEKRSLRQEGNVKQGRTQILINFSFTVDEDRFALRPRDRPWSEAVLGIDTQI